MSNPQICVKELRKTFHVPVRSEGFVASLKSLGRRQCQEVEAVKGISFDIQPGELRIRVSRRSILGMNTLRHDDAIAFATELGQRHIDSFGDGGRTIIVRCVCHVHAGQVRDHGLVLKDRLQGSLRNFGLVGGVGCVEFAAPQDMVDRGGDIVVVDARAKEGNQL